MSLSGNDCSAATTEASVPRRADHPSWLERASVSKGLRRNNLYNFSRLGRWCSSSRRGTRAALRRNSRQFLVADLDPGLVIGRCPSAALTIRPRAGRRAGDQVDDHLVAHQRPAAPVLGDEAEQPMLDLVPLAGARREVADRERQSRARRPGPAAPPSTAAMRLPLLPPPSAVISNSLAPREAVRRPSRATSGGCCRPRTRPCRGRCRR